MSITSASIPAIRPNRPVDLAERFKPGKYDVYILGDVDSSVFKGDELNMLAQASSAAQD